MKLKATAHPPSGSNSTARFAGKTGEGNTVSLELEAFLRNLPGCSEVDELLDRLQRLIVKGLGMASFQVYLLDEITRDLVPCRTFPARRLPRIPELLEVGSLSDCPGTRLADFRPRGNPAARAAVRRLKAAGAEWVWPLRSRERLIGLLLVGRKRKAGGLTQRDLQRMSLLARHVSAAVDRLLLADELELVGQMSCGMAHDLRSLLTPISTFLQLAAEGSAPLESRGELLPVALRNLDTIHAYIRQALVFTRRHQPLFQRTRVDLLVRRAVDLVETQWEQKLITMRVKAPRAMVAELDEVLMLRLLNNLLVNAIHAAPAGSRIVLELRRGKPSRADVDQVRIRVTDAGKGLSAAMLQRILSPGFARKRQRESDDSFGLGLAICRKIACLHGGTLRITSAKGRGTAVQLRLPVRQRAPQPSTS